MSILESLGCSKLLITWDYLLEGQGKVTQFIGRISATGFVIDLCTIWQWVFWHEAVLYYCVDAASVKIHGFAARVPPHPANYHLWTIIEMQDIVYLLAIYSWIDSIDILLKSISDSVSEREYIGLWRSMKAVALRYRRAPPCLYI